MNRYESLQYFSPFLSDIKEIYYFKKQAYIISDELKGVVTVSGDSVTTPLVCEIKEGEEGEVKRAPYDDFNKVVETKNLAKKRYDILFYFNKNDIYEFLSKIKESVKKKATVVFKGHGDLCTVDIICSKKILGNFTFSIPMYSNHKGIEYEDFAFKISSSIFLKILFYGFENCDRIGIKLDNDSDTVLFFNNSITRKSFIVKRHK